MHHARLAAALLVAAVAVGACSGGSSGAKNPSAGDESALETGVKAPPVPKNVTTTTAPGTAPTTTAGPDVVQTTPTGKLYYLDPKGKDDGKGTLKDPWKSIEASVAKLRAGDTLLVQAGTYDGGTDDTGFLLKGLNGSADKPITVAAAGATKPKLTGGEWKTLSIEESSYVVLRGFETQGSALVDKKPTGGIEIRASHHITITGNYVHDGGGGGIGTNESNHIDIIGNYVSGMAKWNPFQTSGISLFQSREIGGGPDGDGFSMRIIGNTVYGTENITLPDKGKAVTDGNCIIVDSTDVKTYAGRTLIANNICSNNGGRGIHVFQAGNVLAVNNTLYHDMQTASLKEEGGELSAVAASDVVFRNNLVVARADRRTVLDHESARVSFQANLYQEDDGNGNGNGNGNGKGDTKPKKKGDVLAAELLAGDVGLTSPENGDFTLRPGSPAIDAGVPDEAPTTDARGVARTGRPDIGALEAAS